MTRALLAAFVALAALLAAGARSQAQKPEPEPTPPPMLCPKVVVECVDAGMVAAPLTFKARVTGGDPNVKPSFKWDAPGLVIFGGHGTDTLTVEPPLTGGTFKATVRVGGYDRGCADTAECTTSIINDPGARKVSEYENAPPDIERALLDELAAELKNDPTAQGTLICYGGRRSRAGEARRLCKRARAHLAAARGIGADRIQTVDGGFREVPTVETWLVPVGVVGQPVASPTLDPSEVRPPKSARRPPRRRAGRRPR